MGGRGRPPRESIPLEMRKVVGDGNRDFHVAAKDAVAEKRKLMDDLALAVFFNRVMIRFVVAVHPGELGARRFRMAGENIGADQFRAAVFGECGDRGRVHGGDGAVGIGDGDGDGDLVGPVVGGHRALAV